MIGFLRRLFKKDDGYQEALVLYPVWCQEVPNPFAFIADAKAYEECLSRLMRTEYQLALHKKAIYTMASKLAATYFDMTVAIEHGDYSLLRKYIEKIGKDLKKIREVIGIVRTNNSP